MITVREVIETLGYKSLGSIVQALKKKFPKRRQDKLKHSTHLTKAEVEYLKKYKRQRNVTATSK